MRLPITLPDELHRWLREQADRQQVSMARLVRNALTVYRETVDPQLPLPLSEASPPQKEKRSGGRRASH